MRLFYRDWRPTFPGRWVNRLNCWWSGLGLPPRFQAALEVRSRVPGRMRANPVAVATVEGQDYLVSMLGPNSDWVKNIEAAHGDAVIRQGRRVAFIFFRCHPSKRRPSCAKTYASPEAGAGISRYLLARNCRISKRLRRLILFSGSLSSCKAAPLNRCVQYHLSFRKQPHAAFCLLSTFAISNEATLAIASRIQTTRSSI